MTTRYTKDHEWITLDGDTATVGITDHAQGQLGDVVFVDLPDTPKPVKEGDEAAVVESVKAASEVFAPLDGEIIEVNQAIVDSPELVNSDPEGGAWFFKMKLSNTSAFEALMDKSAYDAEIS